MDRETLIKMRNGNEESFRIIVMENQPPLFSFIMNFVLDRTVAKDLLQDTYIRIWQNRWRYDVDRNFMTWALAIAANICKGYLRKNGRSKVSVEDRDVLLNITDSDTDVENMLTCHEWAAAIRAIVHDLGYKQRLVFTLCCLEGYNNDEIGEITGLSPGQIKSNLYAAKQTIKKELKSIGYER